MKKTILTAVAATLISATGALAWEGTPVTCYDKHYVGPTYATTKTLKKEAKTQWEHNKHGQVVEMYYPPVYIESKTLVTEGHFVMRAAPCKH